jgi:hypothetical protein
MRVLSYLLRSIFFTMLFAKQCSIQCGCWEFHISIFHCFGFSTQIADAECAYLLIEVFCWWQVNYVGKAASLYDAGYELNGSVYVISKFIGNTWL